VPQPVASSRPAPQAVRPAPRPVPAMAVTPTPAPFEADEDDSLDFDWVSVLLGLLVLMSVGGLIPFWMFIYYRWVAPIP
jgi:eukaryotic-like serine/threonine-protein kinase